MHALADIPGPPPRFPFGTAEAFAGRRWPWEVCSDYAKEYGGVALAWLLGRPVLVVNDPDLIGEVLDTRWTDFYKDVPVAALKPVITRDSLFISNAGRGWDEARRDNPLSTVPLDEWLNRQVAPMRRVVSGAARAWVEESERGPIDLYWDTQRLIFDAFSQAFWGRTFPADRFDWFQALARTGTRRMALPRQILPPINPEFYADRRRWYESLQTIVREARSKPDPAAPDLLNVTLTTGTRLNDFQLAEALATNFFGGVFSCSSTVNTAFYLLAKHPAEREKVARAARDELPAEYDRAALDGCRTLEFAIRETMRFFPAVSLYFRNSAKDREVKLGGHTLPPDTPLFISNWYLHKFSPYWQEPETFAPSRWDNGVAEMNPYGSGYFFPFGRGPRTCIGSQFALLAIRLVLATLYRETELSVEGEYRQSFFFGVMMPEGLSARFRARSNA
jgi:cytochrome P450